MCGSSVPACVTHLEGFKFASICHTEFVMHIYVDDEPIEGLVCVVRVSMVARKHQNEIPALE